MVSSNQYEAHRNDAAVDPLLGVGSMTNHTSSMTRREAVSSLATLTGAAAMGTALASSLRPHPVRAAASEIKPKRVAGIATVYFPGSHCDVIFGKILEGWKQTGGPGPALELTGLYFDQFPKDDIGREMARKHGVRIYDTIEGAITQGTGDVAVEAIICIGEHGDYPHNDLGQDLYPRKRFLSEIAATLEKCGTIVPVFNDKHIATTWEDAKWSYDRMRALKVPFLAGSSLPLTFRKPDLDIPMGAPIEELVGFGYGEFDRYGFHALECFQTIAERRRGAESGVEWVQCFSGDEMWQAIDDGLVSRELVEAAARIVPNNGRELRKAVKFDNSGILCFRYRDGVRGAVCMFNGYATGTAVAFRTKGGKTSALQIEERTEPRFPHFAYLTKAIERMVHTGKSPYPAERTLLTGGILDRALHSRYQGGKRIDTPELAIAYQPVDYPHAPHTDLSADPTAPF